MTQSVKLLSKLISVNQKSTLGKVSVQRLCKLKVDKSFIVMITQTSSKIGNFYENMISLTPDLPFWIK